MTAAMAKTSSAAATTQASTTIHIMMSGIFLLLPRSIQRAAGLSFAVRWSGRN